METQSSHPFFVYGKGWASFSPEEALHAHGLKCQLLEVGDVCISLTPRDQPKPTSAASAEVIGSPQNLSRKQMSQTISTTATGTAVTSRPIPSYEPSHYSQQLHHHHQQQLQHQQQQQQQMMSQRHLSDTIYGMHARASVPERKFSTPMAPPPPPSSLSSSSSSSAESPYDGEAIDATMHSRKRRTWSICENICDDPKKSKPN